MEEIIKFNMKENLNTKDVSIVLVSHFLPDKIEFKEDVIRKADIIFCAT
ncbi:MAG: hypothetical protein LBU14_04925 [Candidatus Peribacteria bacterium]|nr:hypothetical protein [Candidatus Peribacteria bacterium]